MWLLGGEVALDQIIVDWWSRSSAVTTSLLAEHRPPGVVAADPPRGPLGHRLTHGGGFPGEESVAEFRVLAVGIEQGIRPIRRGQLGIGDRAGQPPVVGLARELKYPTRHATAIPSAASSFTSG